MARSVNYSVVPRINPSDKELPPRYYAQAQASGDVSVREMSERIQAACTVTKADVHAVLIALEDVIIDALKGGEIVRLGDLAPSRSVSAVREPSAKKITKSPSSRRHVSTSVRALPWPVCSLRFLIPRWRKERRRNRTIQPKVRMVKK